MAPSARRATEIIERLASFEQKHKVKLEATSLFVEDIPEDEGGGVRITINTEVHPLPPHEKPETGSEYSSSLYLHALCYDEDGILVFQTTSMSIDVDQFLGFEPVKIELEIETCPHKIRLFPKGL